MSAKQAGPCNGCGQPTTAKSGLCTRCQYARKPTRATIAPSGPEVPCPVCGQPTTDFTGVCQRAPACRTEHTRRYNAARREAKARDAKRWRDRYPERRLATDRANRAAQRKGSA